MQTILLEHPDVAAACAGFKSDIIQSADTDQKQLDFYVECKVAELLSYFLGLTTAVSDPEESCRFPEFIEDIAKEIKNSRVWVQVDQQPGVSVVGFHILDSQGKAILYLKTGI